MPIYEYQCRSCCHCFEYLALSSDEAAPPCPECQCADVEKLMSAGCIRAHGIATGKGGFDAKAACKPSG